MRSAYALSANVCERSTRSIRLRLSEPTATAGSAQITRSRAAWRTEMATRAAAQNECLCNETGDPGLRLMSTMNAPLAGRVLAPAASDDR
jgi:hypothetical protein